MDAQYKKCHYCKEEILKDATVCKFCRSKVGLASKDATGIIMALIFIGVIFLIVIITSISDSFSSSSDSSQSQTDIQKLSAFHQKVMALDIPLENAAGQLADSLQNDIQNGNIYGLYDDAKNLNDLSQSTYYQVTTSLKIPTFDNAEVQKNVQNIYDHFNNYCILLLGVSKKIMEMANNPSPATVIDAERAALKSSPLIEKSTAGIALNLVEAYKALGYDPAKVDMTNGGLLNSTPQDQSQSQTDTQATDE